MHWVSRGTEPNGLASIRSEYTPRWVQHYRNGVGTKPADSHWRRFHDGLDAIFFGLCGYCEEISRGEIDHFRPKSRFPELVYDWSNWNAFLGNYFTGKCIEMNPPAGHFSPLKLLQSCPCSRSRAARPEIYFSFPGRRTRAMRMINDLRLNEDYHLRKRGQCPRPLRSRPPGSRPPGASRRPA